MLIAYFYKERLRVTLLIFIFYVRRSLAGNIARKHLGVLFQTGEVPYVKAASYSACQCVQLLGRARGRHRGSAKQRKRRRGAQRLWRIKGVREKREILPWVNIAFKPEDQKSTNSSTSKTFKKSDNCCFQLCKTFAERWKSSYGRSCKIRKARR